MYPAQRINIPEEDRPIIFERIEEVFDTGMMAYGKYVEKFEKEWADVCKTKYAIATNACTTALEILIRSLDIPKNKKILLQTNTYVASAQACLNAGYKVRLFDIRKDLNLDIPAIERKDLDGVGAVMIVHIGGNVSQYIWDLKDECHDADIPLLEDCAHAHGVLPAGSYGEGGCFSFYPTKLITVGGEGGMIVTDDSEIAEFARAYRHHGRRDITIDHSHIGFEYRIPGSNYCMDEIKAIIGLSQVKRLPEYMERRRKVARIYREKFRSINNKDGNYYKFITYDNLKVPDNVRLSGSVYDTPLHRVTYLGSDGVFPNADRYCRDHRCLPIYNDQTDEDALKIMDAIEVIE